MKRALGLAAMCALMARVDLARPTIQSTHDPTGGRLVTAEGDDTVDIPLAHTDVRIRVDGHLAEAAVTQTFHNPYPDKIDAVYLFPLPTDAAVTSLTITTGGRTIEGTIRERGEAKRVYERARRKGHVAALLTQQRPNLFTQAVANLEPGASIDVRLTYIHAPAHEDGGYELVFPMVAGPRYVPGGGADPTVQPAVLPPGMRSSHDIALAVELDAGVSVRALESPSHELVIQRDDDGRRAELALAPGDTIPNRDFVLRWQVAGDAPEVAVLAHRDGRDSEGALFLIAQPPADAGDAEIAPREIVFVLDTSSSMAGAPLAKAKALIRRVLGGLRPDDTFQIVRFDDAASALGPAPIAVKPRNLGYVYDWLDALDASGGTEMIAGIEAALAVPHDPHRLRIVVFVTDGYIGNEDDILRLVGERMGASRLFSFGVGSAVNRYLLEEMAALGRGEAQVITPADDTAAAVDRFYRRIDRAVLTDVRIDWGGLAVTDVTPAAAPDLFVGQPVVLAARYATPGTGTVTVHGRRNGREVSFPIQVTLPDRRERPAVATVWARRRIAELMRQLVRRDDPELVAKVVELSLSHGVLTRYTAFVAVDSAHVTAGGPAREVRVPVEVPAGVRAIDTVAGGAIGSVGYGMGGGYGYGVAGTGVYGSIGHGAPAPARETVDPGPVSAPAPRDLTVGVASVRGDLDRDAIGRSVRARKSAVRACYEKQLAREPDLEGTVVVTFTVSGDGTVTAVTATGLGNAEVEACIAGVVRGIQFPASGTETEIAVRYPFVLRRAEEPR